MKNKEYLNLVAVNEAATIITIYRHMIYTLTVANKIKGFKGDTEKDLIMKQFIVGHLDTCYNNYAARATTKEGCA